MIVTHKVSGIHVDAVLVARLIVTSPQSTEGNTPPTRRSMGGRKHYTGLSNFGRRRA